MKASRWRARSSIVAKTFGKLVVLAAARAVRPGMRHRGDRRQRVVELVADHADDLLPGLHFLAPQLLRAGAAAPARAGGRSAGTRVRDRWKTCSSSPLTLDREQAVAATRSASASAGTASSSRASRCPRAGGRRAAACARRGCRRSRGPAASHSSIATGVFCTMVSSSSSRCDQRQALLAQGVAERVVGVAPDRRARRCGPSARPKAKSPSR
jgi:hypothetical protein